MPKVSIIIPLHNAGEHLHDCLQSIQNQSFKDFEVIVVDDCSTDGSGSVVDELALADNRFKVWRNAQNLHIGMSRNRAIELAQGTYITFSDHDDIQEPNWLQEMVEAAEKNKADILINIPHTTLEHDETNVSHFPSEAFVHTKEYILTDLLSKGARHGRNNSLFNLVIGNFYKREFIVNHQLQFVDTKEITPEDQLFQLEAVVCTNNIALIDKVLYHHINHDQNEGSSRSYLNISKRLNGLERAKSVLVKHHLYDSYAPFFLEGGGLQVVLLMANTLVSTPFNTTRTRRTIKNHPLTKEMLPFVPASTKGFLAKQFRKFIVALLK